MQAILLGKKNRKKNKSIDISINKTYNIWEAVSDVRRSFFVWKGKRSTSPKELEIKSILLDNKIRFHREVSFDRNKRFDFYLPDFDVILEYDGQQHFTEITQIKNDIYKENILKTFGVKLFRYNKTHTNLNDCIYKDLKQFLN